MRITTTYMALLATGIAQALTVGAANAATSGRMAAIRK
jgi:hypothetical protein